MESSLSAPEAHKNGQGFLGRKSHRGKQRPCRCRGPPVFTGRKCQTGIPAAQQSHYGLSVEGQCPLFPCRRRRHAERERSLVLPRTEARSRANQGPHRFLEWRPRRELTLPRSPASSYFAISFLKTAPSYITNRTCSSSPVSFRGSPNTARTSANGSVQGIPPISVP